MKSLTTYISEKQNFLINNKIDNFSSSSTFLYIPSNKTELTEAIVEEFFKGNYDLNCIDTHKINDMSNLFPNVMFNKLSSMHLNEYRKCKTLFDVSNWNFSNVENTSHMFAGLESMNPYLGNWDVRNLCDANNMFNGCFNFTGEGLENWKISSLVDASKMFYNCTKLKFDISKWDLSSVSTKDILHNCNKMKKYQKLFA